MRVQKFLSFLGGAVFFGMVSCAFGSIIDFTGGVAYLSDGSTVTTTNDRLYYSNVVKYIEDGVEVDFLGAYGIIGDYYGVSGVYDPANSVIHYHWTPGSSIVFSKVDHTTLDLNYVDVTSNTQIGGGKATGNENSYITNSNGDKVLLPSSDWGFDKTYFGEVGDGEKQVWFSGAFKNITSFTVTSENAYCFGMDNFYIDQPPPPHNVPEPATTTLLFMGYSVLSGFCFFRRRR